MQLMMQGNAAPVVPEQPVPRAGFNFTYFKEGEEPQQPEEPIITSHMQPGMMPYPHMVPPMYYNHSMEPSSAQPAIPATKEVKVRASVSTKKKGLVVPSVVMKAKK
jgi:hypothetical protein